MLWEDRLASEVVPIGEDSLWCSDGLKDDIWSGADLEGEGGLWSDAGFAVEKSIVDPVAVLLFILSLLLCRRLMPMELRQ